jgi:hypothetical protein
MLYQFSDLREQFLLGVHLLVQSLNRVTHECSSNSSINSVAGVRRMDRRVRPCSAPINAAPTEQLAESLFTKSPELSKNTPNVWAVVAPLAVCKILQVYHDLPSWIILNQPLGALEQPRLPIDEFATAIEVLGACSGELPGSYGVTKQGNHRTLKW